MIAPNVNAWELSNAPQALSENRVDLWRIQLGAFHSQAPALSAELTPEEAHRGNRFVLEKDRLDFVVGRSILRSLLSGYLGVAPRYLEIQTGPRGKPILSKASENKQVSFNLSHSHGLSVIAFRGSGEIGVDIEKVREEVAVLDIAARYFAPEESAYLRGLVRAEQVSAFFSLWTKKEAFVKGLGEGLHVSLNDFRVDASCSQGHLVKIQDGTPWRMYTFEPADGYAGALATEGTRDLTIRYLEYMK